MEKASKISLVLGYDPTLDKDAVGSYTKRLHENLTATLEKQREQGLDVELTPLRPASLYAWVRDLNSIFRQNDLVHIGYPFEGWGTSVVPGLYPGFLRLSHYGTHVKVVTTLHEWRSMHPLRKASILPLVLFSDGILFVSRREHEAFKNSVYYRLRANKPITDTIPTGTNLMIPTLRGEDIFCIRRRLLERDGLKVDVLLGYFGFIYAAKQPDKLLYALKSLLEQGVKARLVIAGDFARDHFVERNRFVKQIEALGLERHVLLLGFIEDEMELSYTLSACNVILLLFSDGVSARRSSFWTVLELGTPLITTEPSSDDEFGSLLELRRIHNIELVDAAISPKGLAATIVSSFRSFRLPRQRKEISPGWENIAERHICFYRKILQRSL
jgi:glycosyltransferase involved in cell wall biosynthesis